MTTFIALIDFTEQGIRDFKATTQRADAFVEAAKSGGVTVKEIYWTMGAHDAVLILDAPDEATVAGVLISLAAQGNVKTHTLRAFTRQEIKAIIGKMPG